MGLRPVVLRLVLRLEVELLDWVQLMLMFVLGLLIRAGLIEGLVLDLVVWAGLMLMFVLVLVVWAGLVIVLMIVLGVVLVEWAAGLMIMLVIPLMIEFAVDFKWPRLKLDGNRGLLGVVGVLVRNYLDHLEVVAISRRQHLDMPLPGLSKMPKLVLRMAGSTDGRVDDVVLLVFRDEMSGGERRQSRNGKYGEFHRGLIFGSRNYASKKIA